MKAVKIVILVTLSTMLFYFAVTDTYDTLHKFSEIFIAILSLICALDIYFQK